ncbi:MAG: signal peptidase II [Spongiibacteraceae bacterium]|jgi:signal peptidase II|nr:signal peptidase II [Spongiibacteraceae bacterium]
MPLRRIAPWLALAVGVVLLDHLTKWLATALLDYGRPVEILPVFNLMLAHNTGAAFSFLSDAGGWQRWFFALIAIAVSAGLLIWLLRAPRGEWLLSSSLALVLGGAIGNLIDRVWQGYVVDFISLHYGGWYFPAFNVADMAITVGAAMLFLDMFINPHNHGKRDDRNGKTTG